MISASQLAADLVDWSVKNSGYEDHRQYIGLSGIGDCERVIYDRVRNGSRGQPVAEHLKTRLSYECEGLLVARLRALGVYGAGESISLHGGLVQGHTDGVILPNALLEIKTVQREDWLPQNYRLPNRVFWQVQAYMTFLKRPIAFVVYLARDTGAMCVVAVKYNPGIGRQVREKVDRLIKAVVGYERPECSCGKCEVEPRRREDAKVSNG